MDRILIVSSGEKATAMLVNLLKEVFPVCKISFATNSIDAKRTIGDSEYDSVIINCPLSDEFGSDLAEIVTSNSNSSCVMLVKSEKADIISDKVVDYGVMVIPKPLGRQSFYRTMKFVEASRKRMLGLQTENLKLQKKLEEIRMVNRAKFALMQYLGFTEQQAHRYLEKQAMDESCTKMEVAKKVIKMYEV